MLQVLTFHGINVVHPDFDLQLKERCHKEIHGIDLMHWTTVSWAHNVFDELLAYRNLYTRPRRRWYLPWTYYKARLLDQVNESLVWIRAYEDPDVRKAILNYTTGKVSQLAQTGFYRYAFIGHSLGSVIAVDTIVESVNRNIIAPTQVHAIVTMGSPLHLWKAPRRLASFLAGVPFEARSGRWLNIYDQDDIVGGRLYPVCPRVWDRPVQTGGLLTSHCGYWDSRAVAETVDDALGIT